MKNPNYAGRAGFWFAIVALFGGWVLPSWADSATLEWDRPNGNITQYRVYRSTAPTGAFTMVVPTGGTQTEINNISVVAGHRFYVTAVNAQGVESDPSNIVEIGPDLDYSMVGGRLSIRWSDPRFTLQTANTVTGPWTILSTISPTLINLSGIRKFFRLWKP